MMQPMPSLCRWGTFLAVLLMIPAAGAQTVAWNSPAGGSFTSAANWNPAIVPGPPNIALFGLANTYTVSFGGPVTNTAAFITAGNVTFSEPHVYSQSGSLSVAGGSLALVGTVIGAPAVFVQNGSRLTVTPTGRLEGGELRVASAAANNGTALFNSGTLLLSGSLIVGRAGGAGTVSFTGNAFATVSQIQLASGSGVAGSSGTLTLANTSSMSASGNVEIATAGATAQVGLLRVSDLATFTQPGAGSISIGAAVNSVGTLEILGGNFTTGSGSLTINPTGTLRLAGTGVFNANGKVLVTGGTLDISAGTFNLAPNLSVNLAGAATARLGSALAINSGHTWNITGSAATSTVPCNLSLATVGSASLMLNAGTISTAGGAVTIGNDSGVATLSLINGSAASFGSVAAQSLGSFRMNVAGGSTLSAASFTAGGNVAGCSLAINTGGQIQVTNRFALTGASLAISDPGSALTAGSIAISSLSTATLNDGTLRATSGGLTVNGTLNAGGGTVHISGPLAVIGGTLAVASPGTLRPLTGFVTVSGGRLAAPAVTVSGTLSASADALLTADALALPGGQHVIEGGSDLVVAGNLDVAYQSTGGSSTLTLRNPGTTITVQGSTRIGGDGAGSLVVSDSAVGTFVQGMQLAENIPHPNRGFVSVDSGAAITLFDDLRIATLPGALTPPTGTVMLATGGQMTLLTPLAGLQIGSGTGTSGTLAVNSAGKFIMHPAAPVTLNATGTILINGGEARLGTFASDPAGRIVFTAGTLGMNGVLNVSPAGALGNALLLASDRALHHGGTFTIANGTVTLAGGTLSVGTFGTSTASILFQSGTLRITGGAGFALAPGQMLGASLTLNPDRTLLVDNGLTIAGSAQLHVAGGTLAAGSTTVQGILTCAGGSVSTGALGVGTTGRVSIGPTCALNAAGDSNNAGRIELGGGIARVGGTGSLTNSGLITGHGEIALPLANTASGELRADSGQTLHIAGTFAINSGRISINGGRVDLGRPLTSTGTIDLNQGVFNAAAGLNNTGRMTGRGTLRSDSGIFNTTGTMTFSGGVSDINAPTLTNGGKTIITGGGLVTFFGAVVNQPGSELRVSTASTAVFLGDVTGASMITGGGLKIFEAGASGLLATPGDSVVEPSGDLSLVHVRERSMTINGGKVSILPDGTPTGTSRLTALAFAGAPDHWAGQFDLSDNAMVIDHDAGSPRATVVNYVKTGRAGGAWTGMGINSSVAAVVPNRAVGIAEASDIGSPPTFAGQAIDATAVLLRFTLPGDANLDQAVSVADLSLLAANFNLGSYWAKGDFNFDGATLLADFSLLAANFNQSAPAPARAGTQSAVPEPAAVTAITAALVLRRRRSIDTRHHPTA